jgi:hypothetical protein
MKGQCNYVQRLEHYLVNEILPQAIGEVHSVKWISW